MKKIVVMRHGHAEHFAASDRERRLTAKGIEASRRQAGLVADFLSVDANANPANDGDALVTIFHSPFRRTTQSAEQLAEALSGLHHGRQQQAAGSLHPDNQLLGNNSAQAVLTWLEKSEISNAVIISHQPLVSALLSLLLDASTANSRAYPMSPATVALLEFEVAAAGFFSLTKLQSA